MLKSFLDVQQRELEQLGQERSRLQQRLQLEQRRQQDLDACRDNLGRGLAMSNSLSLQNLGGMRQQLDKIGAFQAQQTALAGVDLEYQEKILRAQLGKVKGLEHVLQQRELQRRAQEQRTEQKSSDEMTAVREAYAAK